MTQYPNNVIKSEELLNIMNFNGHVLTHAKSNNDPNYGSYLPNPKTTPIKFTSCKNTMWANNLNQEDTIQYHKEILLVAG